VSAARFADETRDRLRTRLLEVTGELTADRGWAAVTMAAVADRVGVSRQTVYNEFGGKPALGEALVMRELESFLTLVTDELTTGDELVPAVGRAVEAVRRAAGDNPLLKDVMISAHGGQASLLPWLTTDAGLLLERASAVVGAAVEVRREVEPFSEPEVARLVEMVVRLVLSHVVQPTSAPDVVGAEVAWMVQRVIAAGPLAP
jgi:AcrR family transcriptional regulator